MWFSALVTLILLESTTCLPHYDLANKDVYEIREDKDTNSVQFINPKAEEPVLREITYYHLVERAYDGTVQTDKVTGSINDQDLSTERPKINSHGHEFEIDLLHHDNDQNNEDDEPYELDDRYDQVDEQVSDVTNGGRDNNWYLHTSFSTVSPHDLEHENEELDETKPVEHYEDWFQKFMKTFVVTEAEPRPVIDQVLPSEVHDYNWFNPAAKVEQTVPIYEAIPMPDRNNWFNRQVANPTGLEHVEIEESDQPQPSEGIVESSYEHNESVETLDPALPVEENRELAEEYVPLVAPEVVETEVLEVNPEEYVANEEISGQEGVVPEKDDSETLEDVRPIASPETAEVSPESIDGVIANSETFAADQAKVVSDAEVVETEGEVEVIEDPILTAAIIEAEGSDLKDQFAGEEEIVEETVLEHEEPTEFVEGVEEEEYPKEEVKIAQEAAESDIPEEETANYETEEQRQRFYQLYQSPVVLQDRYMKLRRDMPNMNIREPDVAVEEVTEDHRRRKRSAMQPDDEIPEAPVLPPLNYDSLPDYIRTIISTDKPIEEKYHSPEIEGLVEAEREPVDYNKPRSSDMFETIRMVQQQTGLGREEVEEGLDESDGVLNMPRSKVRTYGMSINGDHGYVWNDMFSNPGMHYNVGVDTDDVEGHNEEHRPLIEQEFEQKPEPDNNEGTEIEIEEQSNPEITGDSESMKPDEHIVGLETNHEGGHVTGEDDDTEDIYVNFDKQKRPPKPVLDETVADAEEHEVEDEDDGDFEDTILSELVKKKKFWRWLSEWTATYIDLFTEKFATAMQEEISKITANNPINQPINEEKPTIEMHSDNNEAEHPLQDDEHPIIEENDEDDLKTIFINGKEISLTRTSNLDEELDVDDVNEDEWMGMARRGHKKQNYNNDKEHVKVVSKAIYGNTIGNEKVTNIFVFFPDKGNNNIMESLKPLLGSKDEVKPEENKEISVEENASSISEDLDTTKPQESSPADNIEQSKEPEIPNIDSTLVNEPDVPAENISVLTEANKDDINPIESEVPLETNLGTDSVNAEVSVDSPVAISEPIQENKEENHPDTETAMDNSGTGQLDERIIETSTPPITEETINIVQEEVITEEPIVTEVIPENVTPIISITEEPKTSQPIAETVVTEINSEETVTKVSKEELEQDRGDLNIEEQTEITLTENKEAIESSIESGPSEVVKLTDDNLESNLAAQDATAKDDIIEPSSEILLSEPNVITATEGISTATTGSESDSVLEKDKTDDEQISLSADPEITTIKIELVEDVSTVPTETEVMPTEGSELNPDNEEIEVSNVEQAEDKILTIPLESEEIESEVKPSEEKVTIDSGNEAAEVNEARLPDVEPASKTEVVPTK